MPVSKKRRKKGQEKYLDPAQLAQKPKPEQKMSGQQIAIIVVSALIIFAMATSLIFSGLAPTSTTQPLPDDSSTTTEETTSSDAPADTADEPVEESTE